MKKIEKHKVLDLVCRSKFLCGGLIDSSFSIQATTSPSTPHSLPLQSLLFHPIGNLRIRSIP